MGALIGWAAGSGAVGRLVGAVVGILGGISPSTVATGRELMLGDPLSTRARQPGHMLPAAGGAVVLLLALPVFAAAWAGASRAGGSPPCSGSACTALDCCSPGCAAAAERRRGSGMQAFGLMLQGHRDVGRALRGAAPPTRASALAAALTYGLAYTVELGLSLAAYFGPASA